MLKNLIIVVQALPPIVHFSTCFLSHSFCPLMHSSDYNVLVLTVCLSVCLLVSHVWWPNLVPLLLYQVYTFSRQKSATGPLEPLSSCWTWISLFPRRSLSFPLTFLSLRSGEHACGWDHMLPCLLLGHTWGVNSFA